MKFLWAFIIACMSIIMGIKCAFYPEKIREYQLKYAFAWHLHERWLKSKAFLITARVMGVILILISLYLFYAIRAGLEKLHTDISDKAALK